MTLTVALKLKQTVMTSSPGPMPRLWRIASRASVPLAMKIAWRTPQYAAHAFSKASVFLPIASIPERSTSRTASSSAGPMSGREIGIMS